MNKPPELFVSERSVPSDFARRKGLPYALRRVITVAVAAGIIGGGAYLIWRHAGSTPGEIPTVKADGAYKQRPEQPGGIDIPHQDVQVYHEIDGSAEAANAKSGVDHMLPPPEEPNPGSASAAPKPSSAVISVTPTIEDLTAVVAANNPSPSPVMATTVDDSTVPVQSSQTYQPPAASVVAPAAISPGLAAASVAPPAATVQPPVAAIVKPEPASRWGVIVQLAAMPDEAAAEATARKLQAKYSADLGDALLHTVRADLGVRGIFYRVQSQPLSERRARDICDALKNRNAGCILVR